MFTSDRNMQAPRRRVIDSGAESSGAKAYRPRNLEFSHPGPKITRCHPAIRVRLEDRMGILSY